ALFFLSSCPDLPDLHSFPTRRSSDLRTRAILCVHQIGLPCDMRAILEVAKRHSLPVIEDAACAIGSEILWDGKWERIGKPHGDRSEEHTSELQSRSDLVCRLLLEKKN